jgi:hypothetical protein
MNEAFSKVLTLSNDRYSELSKLQKCFDIHGLLLYICLLNLVICFYIYMLSSIWKKIT